MQVAECTPYGLIWHFVGQSVFSLGEAYKQRLFNSKMGMVLQVSEAESNKWYLCCGTGSSCPLASLSNQVLQKREREI